MFKKDFNTVLNEVLTEYKTVFKDELAPGSALYLKASCLASMLWGLYHTVDHAVRQAFVTTADSNYKALIAAEYGISTAGKTDAEIEELVLATKQNKFAGGNSYDYAQWARETVHDDEKVIFAHVERLAQGEGTFDVVVIGNKNDGVVSFELRNKIANVIQERRPVGSGFFWGVRVVPISFQYIDIVYTASGNNFDKSAAESAIRSYINELEFGVILNTTTLITILTAHGAETASIASPQNNQVAEKNAFMGEYKVFRAGTVRST